MFHEPPGKARLPCFDHPFDKQFGQSVRPSVFHSVDRTVNRSVLRSVVCSVGRQSGRNNNRNRHVDGEGGEPSIFHEPRGKARLLYFIHPFGKEFD